MDVSGVSKTVGSISEWFGNIVKSIGLWVSHLTFFEKILGLIIIFSCFWLYKQYNIETNKGRTKK